MSLEDFASWMNEMAASWPIVFIGLLIIVVIIATSYWLSSFIYQKIESYYTKRLSRFFIAGSLFIFCFIATLYALTILLFLFIDGEAAAAYGMFGAMVMGPFLIIGVPVTTLFFAIKKSKVTAISSTGLSYERSKRPRSVKFFVGLITIVSLWLIVQIPPFSSILLGISGSAINHLGGMHCNLFDPNGYNWGGCITDYVERSDDPTKCLDLIPYEKQQNNLEKCIRPFIGTEEWKLVCTHFESTGISRYLVLSRCLTSSTVNNLFVQDSGISAPAWFSYVWYGKETSGVQGTRQWLKSIDVDPNTRNSDGKTSLMLYVERLYDDPAPIIKEMIDFGIDVHAKDSLGKRAIDYAVRNGNSKAATYLLEFEKGRFKPSQEDIEYYLYNDHMCGYTKGEPIHWRMCDPERKKGGLSNALHEYIELGWLQKSPEGIVTIVK